MAFNLGDRPTPKRGGKRAPMKGAEPDPLAEVEPTDSLADDCQAEFAALASAYRGRAQAEAKRFTKTTDSEFWVAVCFDSREQKETFLRQVGIKPKLQGDKYITAADLAAVLGVDLPPSD